MKKPILIAMDDLQRIRKLNVKPDDWIITLSAEIRKDAPLHQFQFPVVVKANLASPLDTMDVSFEGEIVPAISVEPAALIFSDQSREQPKTIHAKSLTASLFLPEPQIRIEDDVPLLCKVERVNDQEVFIVVQINTHDNLPPTSFVGTIVLDFGDEGQINVPVIYQTSIGFL